MRRILLASAALALTVSGQGFAEPSRTPVAATTLAPQESTATDGLVFSKDAGQATPIEQATPAEQPAPIGQASPIEQPAPAAATPAAAAGDAAMADPLKELIERKLSQFVPRERDRAGVLAFYQARNFAPLWLESGKVAPRAEQAKAFLRDVAADGLDPADYPTPDFGNAEPQKLAAAELMLTNSVIAFARHASVGRVAFTRVSGAVYFEQKAPGAADVLGKLAESNDVRATLDAFNPQAPQYKALKVELAAIRSGKGREAQDATTAPKPSAKEAKAKSKKPHHQAKAAEATPNPVSADTIIANMERWRWMPHDLGAAYVMVNIPDYTLKVVQDGKTVWSTKIVVGKPGDRATPLLTETMKYITVNPTWNVPPSIIRNEYLPALARDPGALSRIGLQIGHNKDGSIRIFQPPGERNALGRIRFNFPNRFLVYQHDTPDKKLFNLATRAYSHGCMRVQNPDQYAEVLLGVTQPEDHYTAAKIRSMYGHSERTITFKHQIPVFITYQTAFKDDASKLQARADIYGLDRDVLRELHGDRRNSDTPIARNYNSGSKPARSAANTRPNAQDYQRGRYAENPGYTGWDAFGPQPGGHSAFRPFGRW